MRARRRSGSDDGFAVNFKTPIFGTAGAALFILSGLFLGASPRDALAGASKAAQAPDPAPVSRSLDLGQGVTAVVTEVSTGESTGDVHASLKLTGKLLPIAHSKLGGAMTAAPKTQLDYPVSPHGGSAGWSISREILPGGVRVLALAGNYNPRIFLVGPHGVLEMAGAVTYYDTSAELFFTTVNSPTDGSSVVVADLAAFKLPLYKVEKDSSHPLLDPDTPYRLAKSKAGQYFLESASAQIRLASLDLQAGSVLPVQPTSLPGLIGSPGVTLVAPFGAAPGNWVRIKDWK